jgi:hypothetical protein
MAKKYKKTMKYYEVLKFERPEAVIIRIAIEN